MNVVLFVIICLLIFTNTNSFGVYLEESTGTPLKRTRRLDDIYSLVTVRQTNCYSCMSRRLQDNWDFLLNRLFRPPEHFTESCDPDHFRRGVVKFRNCTDNCIWLIAETQVFGQKIPVYTRGCLSDLLHYRQDAVRKLRHGDFCVRRQLSELFYDGDHKFPMNEIVTLCACHSSYCNGAASYSFTFNMLLLMASGFWRCITL